MSLWNVREYTGVGYIPPPTRRLSSLCGFYDAPLTSSPQPLHSMLPFNIPKLPSLPTFEISPVPELIFLTTVKGLLSFVINLSLLDSALILTIILLVNVNPPIRQKAAQSLSILFLLFGVEISVVNVYALPLTVVIMGILNSVTPVLTDSVLLMHIVVDRMVHAKSRLRLVVIMAVPVLFKFGRLANAAIYIIACAEFVLSSITSGDGVPDMDILDAAQARSMEIASALQIIDNMYHLALYYLNAFEQRRNALLGIARSATSTTPEGLLALFLASAGNFLLPILLSAAQLAVSRRWPDSGVPRDLERIKVVVNIAGAAATSIVAAVKRWRLERAAAAAAEAMAAGAGGGATAQRRDVEANETTGLLAGGQNPSYSKSQPQPRAPGARSCHVIFDAELIDINMKEDQAQMAVVLPVT
ncbi:hypothetical protein BJV78DRAFT_1352366 [Lactifluus subvellereus]|nr:hypothetical protein BJV78DRAFT_1352366 [Lactifluus subvellereus]